ncbi:zinc finger, C2H2 type [Ditylenchus destructor]|nr:zinc finger, C2H2 type [Ditylenchus destructor]
MKYKQSKWALINPKNAHKFFAERDEAVTHQKTDHRSAESVIEDLTRLNFPILLKRLNEYFPQCKRRQEAESTAKRASAIKQLVPIKKKRSVDYVPQELVQCRACRQWHLQYPLHKCTLCDHTTYDNFSRAMNHAMTCHKGGKEIIDSSDRAKSWAQLKLRLLDFFPNLKRMEEMRRRQIMSKVKLEAGSSIKHFPNEKRKALANKLCCGECYEMIGVKSKLLLFSHVNVKHLRLPVYQCAACPMTFCDYMGSLVSRHIRDQHNGDKNLIRDCREQYREQIQAITKELFGPTVL